MLIMRLAQNEEKIMKNYEQKYILKQEKIFRMTPATAIRHLPVVDQKHDEQKRPNFTSMPLQNAMRLLSDQNRNIYVTMVDYGFLDVAINLYLTSFKRLGIKNYVFVALNKRCCDVLDARKINCVRYFSENEAGLMASVYGTNTYNKKTHFKSKIVLELLKLGFNPLFVDADIVFIKNMGSTILKLGQRFDLVAQYDIVEMNSGLYYGNSTAKLVDLFTDVARSMLLPKTANKSEQKLVNAALRRHRNVSTHYLDMNRVCPGVKYWERYKIQFNVMHPWTLARASKTSDVDVIHNNWIFSKAAKVYRFKESLMWLVDDNEYYSSTTRKYLKYNNPYIRGNGKGKTLERKALENALSIGYLLNRTVILPSFHCHETRDEICVRNDQECSLLSHYQVATFDQFFADSYREHVFLSHDLVPETIRQSQSKTFFFNTESKVFTLADLAKHEIAHVLTPTDKQRGATANEITEWLGDVKEHVLVFHDLYDAFVGFENMTSFVDINHRLRSAWKKCPYRQDCFK